MPRNCIGWSMLFERRASPARLSVICAAILAASSGGGRAQPMDYGALESLFGEPVTTSVTGSPQRAGDVPASMTIVTQDEIRRSGARDIPGILRHVAGIDVLQWSNDDADVAVRGYNQAFSPRLLVLVNGRQVYADYYGYTPWSTLPIELSDIRQIEIVKGPNSALFGFNAVGGVVNIITFDPLYDDTNAVTTTTGTQRLIQATAAATFKIGDKAGLRISLGGRKNDDFATPQPSTDIGTRLGEDRLALDILGHAQLGSDIDAHIDLSHSEIRETTIVPSYTALSSRYRVTSIEGGVTTDTGVGLLQATAYANWFKGNSIAPGSAPSFSLDNPLYVAKLSDIFKIGNAHTVRLSVEFRHTAMETTPLPGAHIFYQVLAAGAMWQWNIAPEISLTNAARVDNLLLGRSGLVPPGFGLTNAFWRNRALTEFSFNSGLVWRADGRDTVRIAAARGVQLPNLLDLGGLLLPEPPFGYSAGIPTLKPTIVTNYELSWDRQIPEWEAKLRLRLFHETSHDIFANGGGSQISADLVSTPINIGNSEATGLELILDGTFSDNWRWGLSYTPEIVDDHFPASLPLASTLVDYEDTHPVHTARANLGWAEGPWEVDGYLQYESEFNGIRGSTGPLAGSLVRIPAYVSLDGRIAYRVTSKLTLALSGQNLLQSPQKQTSVAEVERRIEVTAAVDF